MTTFTNSKLTDEYVSNATLIRLILWAEQHNSHYVVAALRELQERRKADSVPVEINDDMAYAFHHALSDSSPGADEVEEIKAGLRAAFANVTAQPASVVPEAEPVAWTDEEELRDVKRYGLGEIFQYPPDKYADSRRVIPLYRVPPAVPQLPQPAVPGEIQKLKDGRGFKYVKDGVRYSVNYANGWNSCRAAMLHGAEPVSQTYKLNELSGNYPVTPDGWISCSDRMPDSKTAVLFAREFDRKGDWRMKWATYIPGHPDANDGWIIPGASWKPSHWMPLPEPPQEVNRG